MKEYIPSNTTLIGIVFITLVSASIYFVNLEFSGSSSHDNSTLSDTAVENNIATTSSLKKVAHGVQVSDTQGAKYHDHNTGRKVRVDAISDRNKGIAILKKSNQVQLTELDLALPPPTSDNASAELEDEYAAQINQQAIVDEAKSEGYLSPEIEPDSHPPTDKNIASEPQGENASEVSQKALIDKAKSEGYLSEIEVNFVDPQSP